MITTVSGEDALPLGETQQSHYRSASAIRRGREEEEDAHTHTHRHTPRSREEEEDTHTHTHHRARLKPLHSQDNSELPNTPLPA